MDHRCRTCRGSVRSARRNSQQADEQAAAGYVHSPAHISLTYERAHRLPPFRPRTQTASAPGRANYLFCRRQGVASSCGAVFARVVVEPLEFIRVNGTHHPPREHALKQAADPICAVPGRRDLHERRPALRGAMLISPTPRSTASRHSRHRPRSRSSRSKITRARYCAARAWGSTTQRRASWPSR